MMCCACGINLLSLCCDVFWCGCCRMDDCFVRVCAGSVRVCRSGSRHMGGHGGGMFCVLTRS
jgi:hypothetical protein